MVVGGEVVKLHLSSCGNVWLWADTRWACLRDKAFTKGVDLPKLSMTYLKDDVPFHHRL